MPKQAFPAAAEGMPNFNRRTFLHGAASSMAVVGVVAAPAVAEAMPTRTENPELQRLHEQLVAQLEERATAEAEIAHIAEEWRDRWPFAPEELLGMAIKGAARDSDTWRAERDIAGRVLPRDPFSKKMRRRFKKSAFDGPTAFYIQTSGFIAETLRGWMEYEPKGRTPRALARNTAWRDKAVSDCRKRLDLEHVPLSMNRL